MFISIVTVIGCILLGCSFVLALMNRLKVAAQIFLLSGTILAWMEAARSPHPGPVIFGFICLVLIAKVGEWIGTDPASEKNTKE